MAGAFDGYESGLVTLGRRQLAVPQAHREGYDSVCEPVHEDLGHPEWHQLGRRTGAVTFRDLVRRPAQQVADRTSS